MGFNPDVTSFRSGIIAMCLHTPTKLGRWVGATRDHKLINHEKVDALESIGFQMENTISNEVTQNRISTAAFNESFS